MKYKMRVFMGKRGMVFALLLGMGIAFCFPNAFATEGSIETEKQQEESREYYQSLNFYLDQSASNSRKIYLQDFEQYAKLQVKAMEAMLEVGEITKGELLKAQADAKWVEAELAVADNEISYYQEYLDLHPYDFSEFSITNPPEIQALSYYKEEYPKKDITILGNYVLAYENASAYIKAKKAEILFLEENVSEATMLYDAGELSLLALRQEQVSLSKSEYELQKYYVERAQAYCSLKLLLLK